MILAPDIGEDSEVLVELAGKDLDCGKSLVVARFETEGWEVVISGFQMCSTFCYLFFLLAVRFESTLIILNFKLSPS